MKVTEKWGREPVTIVGEDGQERQFELREMPTAAHERFIDDSRNYIVLGEDGKVKEIKQYEGFRTALLKRCLFDAAGKLVSDEIIGAMHPNTVSELYREAQKLNGLGAETEAAAEKKA